MEQTNQSEGAGSIDPANPEQFNAAFEALTTELRRLAGRLMADERADHTLQPTALVNEAYLRLANAGVHFRDESHLFQLAATALRRLLVEHARGRNRLKRGGPGGAGEGGPGERGGRVTAAGKRVPLEEVDDTAPQTIGLDPDGLLAVDTALSKLALEDGRLAQVVELRFFAGLTMEQIARVVGVSERSVSSDWRFAKARLRRLMESLSDQPSAEHPRMPGTAEGAS